jgi:TRAP-type C4-dicarboxylate transport system permease large subunit
MQVGPHPLKPLVPFATLVVLLANLLILVVGIAPNFDTRVVDIGERLWPGYAAELRKDPQVPDCDVAALEKQIAACPAEGSTGESAPATGTDAFDGADPFAAPGATPPAPPAEPAPAPPAGDAFQGEDPFATAPAPAAVGTNCGALRQLHARCKVRHDEYASALSRITPGVKAFRRVELAINDAARFPWWKHLMVIVFLAGAISASLKNEHISLRRATATLEYRVAQLAQLAAWALLGVSCIFDWRVQHLSSAEAENAVLPFLFGGGFVVLAAIHAWNVVRPPALDAKPTVTRVLMSIPLYAYLVIIAGLYFLLGEHHWSGQAIYLHKYIGYPNIYLGIALYVWTGMLLAETRVANLTFDVLQPWKLSPYILGWLVAVLSAVPTAYSGASGIFVIAAGKVIFDRLRANGAPRRVALGATAMSGSLGVVLRPCLIIVLIAALNKQVTTDALFAQGIHVFALTSGIYLLFMLLRKGGWVRPASPREALPDVLKALRSIVPYVVIALVVVGAYRLLFDMHLDEHTAAYMLPSLLLGIVLFDRQQGRFPNLQEPLTRATSESTTNAGALLTIMAGSVGFGGIVERSGFMEIVPHDYGSPQATMALLVLVMVAVGMAMDALGAVILVSGTVAPIAYANGIDPVHFWMMALVGFELGYLHPPVGLNILLARQVAGPDAQLENFPEPTFFKRYEHFIVPCLVVGAALFLVAFVPFLWYPIGP